MEATRRHERRKAQQRRALRILLWIPCLFILTQTLGGLLLDYVWVRPRYPTKADTYAQLKARRQPPEILFVGSSRFQGDINCAVMDAELRAQLGPHSPRTFNAALPAADATVFERVLDDLLSDGYRPKMLVVEVDPGAVSGRDNWLYQHALNVLDWRDVPEASVPLVRNRRIIYLVRGRLLPLYLHNYNLRKETAATLKGLFGSERPPAPSDALIPEPVVEDPAPPPLTPAVKSLQEQGFQIMRNEVKNYHLNGLVDRRLERMLSRCQAEGIAVLLVGAPVTTPHRRAFTPEVDAAFQGYIKSLTSRYGCTYTDWRERVADEYFVDHHHAHPKGGMYFSRHFAAETLAPFWRERCAGH